jgi:hypothetical protein
MNSENGPYFVQLWRGYFQVVLNEVKNGVVFVHYIQIIPLPLKPSQPRTRLTILAINTFNSTKLSRTAPLPLSTSPSGPSGRD